MKVDKRLARIAKENAEAISGSECFMAIFSKDMVKEVVPLIQLGFAVYADKPILLLVPESRRADVPKNLERLAIAIEVFDDSLPQEEMGMAMQAATMRLMERAGMVK